MSSFYGQGGPVGMPDEQDMPQPHGITIDGSNYALEGQPPLATGGSWGDTSWMRFRTWLRILKSNKGA